MPLDVVRVRMSCEGGVLGADGTLATGMRAGHAPRWQSSFHCLADCYSNEGGLRGLWRRWQVPGFGAPAQDGETVWRRDGVASRRSASLRVVVSARLFGSLYYPDASARRT